MRRAWLVVLAACSSQTEHRLPGASITPHLAARVRSPACGEDITLGGHGVPDVRYTYSYDALGRLARAIGSYATGADDLVDYTYDNLDHMTHSLETRGVGEARVEVTAEYDTLGDLVDYTWDETAPSYHDARHYVFSTFTSAGQPGRETIGQLGQPDLGYQLDYDASARITRVVQDGGATTIYTYDDHESRTITIDTGNGAVHGVLVYDDQDHEQSETWDGTDPSVIASETRYDWDAGRLLDATYLSGTTAAPHQLATVETDTLRYDCPAALARRAVRWPSR